MPAAFISELISHEKKYSIVFYIFFQFSAYNKFFNNIVCYSFNILCYVNLGTELWETNLRNGGQPPPAVAQKTPWGHTPTTNIGGTWGEDDDVSDTSNVWTGVPPSGAAPPPAQWGAGNNPGPATPMWGK